MKALPFALLVFSFFLFGCISDKGFSDQDIKNPCSIVSADEIASVCGYPTLKSQDNYIDLRSAFMGIPFGNEVSGACEYLVTDNRSSMVASTTYLPNSGISGAEYKKELEKFNTQMDSGLEIEREGLGFGDSSYLILVNSGNSTEGIAVQVFDGASVISVVISSQDGQNKCFEEEKAIGIAKLAFDNLKKK